MSYKQGEGTTMKRFKYPIMGGVVYNNKNHLLELSGDITTIIQGLTTSPRIKK
ncbi:MAG: hypothetical protein IPK08_20090 [Bacteroidetes bacterium]|nr:hypothetical protein [Bacteroidota bacterium]